MIYLSLSILFILSVILTHFYIRYAWRKNWIDTPNVRSSHLEKTPRGGGVVFITLWVIANVLGFFFHLWSLTEIIILLPGTLLVAITGFCDDCFNLPVHWRALFYLVAAIFTVTALGGFSQFILHQKIVLFLGWGGSILALLAILWSINLFNFMDGLDGLAATEALFILIVGGFFTAQVGGQAITMIAWSLAACLAGFLVWNKPPAKVFMGDVGSTTLGFIIMVLALWSEKRYGVPALLWFMLYGVFLVDATLTLLRRLIAKEVVYQAHRLHAYQRLQQMGFSHTQVWLMTSAVNILLAVLAIGGFYYQQYLLIFALLALVILLGLYSWIERVKPMYNKAGTYH